jgi:hypothetical protein
MPTQRWRGWLSALFNTISKMVYNNLELDCSTKTSALRIGMYLCNLGLKYLKALFYSHSIYTFVTGFAIVNFCWMSWSIHTEMSIQRFGSLAICMSDLCCNRSVLHIRNRLAQTYSMTEQSICIRGWVRACSSAHWWVICRSSRSHPRR